MQGSLHLLAEDRFSYHLAHLGEGLSRMSKKLSLAAHAYDLSTWEANAEAGETDQREDRTSIPKTCIQNNF